jgi:putative ABC transport system ATP-binding protein
MKIVHGEKIRKHFGDKEDKRTILNDISIKIQKGEFVTIMGPSGSGKSTLMYVLSGMDQADSGNIFFEEHALTTLKEKSLADLRRNRMGFVFQQPTFLKNLSILDNIILPAMRENKHEKHAILQRADALMTSMGISELGMRDVTQVSGGQLQRAGICRALINNPSVIFGDEPTGALNSLSSQEIMKILLEINALGTTIILVTHDVKVAAMSEKIFFLEDGKIINEMLLSKYQEKNVDDRIHKVSEEMLRIGI